MHLTYPGAKQRLFPQFRRTLYLAVIISLLCSAFLVTPLYAQGVHVVGRGEYLSAIAVRYGVSMSSLIAANGLSNPNVIVPGQRLVIPGASGGGGYAQTSAASGYYTVRRGDSLSMIAQNNGMSLADLMRLNGIGNANFIWVGQQLRLSARVAPTSAPADVQAAPQVAGSVYVVRAGDTLSAIALRYGTSIQALLVANGLPNANFVWVGQRLRISGVGAVANYQAAASPVSSGGGRRWIEINLSAQTLTAWEGDTAVMNTAISGGVSATPTVTGRFSVYTKYDSQRMTGPGYDLPNVPSVMYFYSNYAIHGAYWHNNFGTPMSHGCVNMRPGDAGMLYNWAPIGTEVYVHY
jgi:LysM repeat protein